MKNYIKKYYRKNGGYLEEHADFFSKTDIGNDLHFLIKALKIKKADMILDIACGQGRHANALAKKGYRVDGIDFSRTLLDMAKESAKSIVKRRPRYFLSNIENFKLHNKYGKAYWFFSDLANLNLPKTISSINHNMKVGGMVLFDTDNIFRILDYLTKNYDLGFDFDASRLELIDNKNNLRIIYPVLPLWEHWLRESGFSIRDVWGNYKFGMYTLKSPRLIIVAKKIA